MKSGGGPEMTVKRLPTKNIYWRDVIAAKPTTRLEGDVYFVTQILCADENDDYCLEDEIYFLQESVVFWHGQESAQAQRALDALITWQRKTQQESIERIVKKVVCK